MSNLQIFSFEKNEVRTFNRSGQPWFVAGDITEILGYKNGPDAVKKHCKYAEILRHSDSLCLEIGDVNPRGLTVIPQPDVYRLVSKSTLPAAEQFEKFLFDELVPTVMKTGSYGIAQMSQAELTLKLAQQNLANENKLIIHADKIAALESKFETIAISSIPSRESLPESGLISIKLPVEKVKTVKPEKVEEVPYSTVNNYYTTFGIKLTAGQSRGIARTVIKKCRDNGFEIRSVARSKGKGCPVGSYPCHFLKEAFSAKGHFK